MRRVCAVVAFLAPVLFGSVLLAPSGFAHATLTSTDPADGDRLDSVPDRIELTFSEPVGLANGYLRVIDERGNRVDDATPETARNRLSVGMRTDLPDGSFLISYRLISADSHPIAGSLAFVVGDGPLLAANDSEQLSTSDPVVGGVFSVLRWVSYAGLVLLVGPLVIAGLCWSAAWRVPIVGRLFRLGVGVSIGAAALSVIVQALYVSGTPLTGLLSIDVLDILETTYGVAMLVRIALVVVLALLVRWSVLSGLSRPGGSTESILGTAAPGAFWAGGVPLIGIALTYSIAGHPIASPSPVLMVPSDVIHLLAMSVWLGGLLVIVIGDLPRYDAGLVAEVLPRFSTLALFSIGALLISGTVQAVLEISPPAALWSTSYGLLVTLKVIGFAVIVGVASRARTWVRSRYLVPAAPKTDPAEHAAGPLRRSLLLEIGVAAIVLALAAVLVATVPARTAFVAPYAGSLALPDGGTVDLTVEPAQFGPNLVRVDLLDETGQPLEVRELSGTAELSAQEIGPLEIPLRPAGPGRYTATGFSLSMAGLWEMTFNLRFGEFDATSVTAEVPVS